jgi:hypothetical protein
VRWVVDATSVGREGEFKVDFGKVSFYLDRQLIDGWMFVMWLW